MYFPSIFAHFAMSTTCKGFVVSFFFFFDCQVDNPVVNFIYFYIHILNLQCDFFFKEKPVKHNAAVPSQRRCQEGVLPFPPTAPRHTINVVYKNLPKIVAPHEGAELCAA